MAKINLFFDKFEDEDNPGYAIIRLKCGIQLRKENGWSLPYTSVIDTGAHTSVLPLSVWQELSIKKIKPYKIYGISKDERCGLPGMLGEINIILVDEKGNQSSGINAIFFLAEMDQVPIIIGFKGLLECTVLSTRSLTGGVQKRTHTGSGESTGTQKEPPRAKRASRRSVTGGGRFLFEKLKVSFSQKDNYSFIED